MNYDGFSGRSPVFSHLTATISGLATIRARNIQQELVDEFDGLQDIHSAVWQLATSSNTACGLWLDVVSTAFIACVTFSFIVLYESKFRDKFYSLHGNSRFAAISPYRHIQRQRWFSHFASIDTHGNGSVWCSSSDGIVAAND